MITYNKSKDSKLVFRNPVVIYGDTSSNKRLCFISECSLFYIAKNQLDMIDFQNSNQSKNKYQDWMFLPRSSIYSLKLFGVKRLSSPHEFDASFIKYNNKNIEPQDGFLLPACGLFQTSLKDMTDLFRVWETDHTKYVISQLLSVKNTRLKVKNYEDILNIQQLYPEHFSHIQFLLENQEQEMCVGSSGTSLIFEKSILESTFYKIRIDNALSAANLQLIWKILGCQQTRLILDEICLEFKLLSECISTLTHGLECRELTCIYFSYLEVDMTDEQTTVDAAIADFKRSFGFIRSLTIYNEE